ncbi:NAD(P)-binding protein [Macroventuria anomochaeta]|uniref:NAD(P)-binding protein n=1 Tax=Macroventuria anomochaeta TaxID=301207 RepID=A0ACB6RQX5_9PLEO|nr:NAD(P)-binding protein [Macroventuria anomochaeta]KAF2623528.1 NAD(P)-binding protein [Macroventuria anomochaeta]
MASKQADYIRKVALVGASGKIGSHILSSILDTGKHSVTILTRPDSSATFPSSPNVNVVRVDYASEEDLISALRGHDFLVITLSVQTSPTNHALIVEAAAKAGVKWIMPNYWAFAPGPRGGTLSSDPLISSFGKFIDDVRNVSVPDGGVKPNWIALCCGFWYEFSLSQGEPWFGFDIKNRRVTLYDEGEVKINTSTWELCGNAVASLLSLPIASSEHGKPAVEDWKNQGIHISSFLISQREMLDSLNRVLGTSDEDWTITKDPVKTRYEKGLQQLQGGDRLGFAKAMYARCFFPGEGGDYETGYGLDNGKLGLPKESLDKATKRAVEMVKGGAGIH